MIKTKKNTEHYFWGENCDSWIFHNAENLVVKQEIMPPKTSEKLHFHELAQQFFYVLKGEATFYLYRRRKIYRKIRARNCYKPQNETFHC